MFWTGKTKFGCAGQYSDCFSDGNDDNYEGTILPNDNGGACVGFALSGDELIEKTMPCERKCFLACQSLRTAKTVISDVSNKVLLVAKCF